MRPAEDLLDGLVSLAADAAAADRNAVRGLVDLLLATPAEGRPPVRGRSGLNHDGAPLEVCLSAAPDACRTRVIADPASTVGDPFLRRQRSLAALGGALEATHSEKLALLCGLTLGMNVPGDGEALREYVEGVLWIGAAIGLPGIAVYVDATRKEPGQRWDDARSWLTAVLAVATEAAPAVAALRVAGELMAVGIEGSEPANARLKLFWRLRRPVRLAEIGLPAFDAPSFHHFLAQALGRREIPLSGLVFSASFLVANGQPFDAKVDVCGHCLGGDAAGWQGLVDATTAEFGLAPLRLEPIVAAGAVEVAFVGLNRNALGQHRLDVFLKPPRWYAAEATA